MSTDQRAATANLPLFQRILGQSWQQLAPPIRQLHSVTGSSSFAGRCTVRRGGNPLARLMGWVMGFPKAGADQPIRVRLSVQGDGERWVRTCGGRSFASTQQPAQHRSERLVSERFGPVAVEMSLRAEGPELRYSVRRWSLLGIHLPLAWGPRSTAAESVHDGAFKFDVEVGLPLAGLIVHYVGVLTPEA